MVYIYLFIGRQANDMKEKGSWKHMAIQLHTDIFKGYLATSWFLQWHFVEAVCPFNVHATV